MAKLTKAFPNWVEEPVSPISKPFFKHSHVEKFKNCYKVYERCQDFFVWDYEVYDLIKDSSLIEFENDSENLEYFKEIKEKTRVKNDTSAETIYKQDTEVLRRARIIMNRNQ